ncbi:E3 ubiquitin-protein ligase TRIM62-like isoform X1 [Alosa sapidissima]|uniref:E3 ubiquitin-protein ligase TRIM62-like isoform X1 n=1 Tax=Alosa sapidissima TaxID=34773 RepID=UPI001C085406|nr:E3 ubiquitin-protein ligase TRIM62-like isoform X1 [Alosa sapidissima]
MADFLSLDEELICAVCRDIFVEPVTLPCGHNYCEECVNQLKRSSTEEDESHHYTCPLCLAPCDVRIDFKKNIVLHNILEKYHQSRQSGHDCSICKGEQKLPAEKTCLNCEESYCTLHIMPHFENSILRQHVLVNPISNINKLCKSHGKELELYCQTDHAALCVYCMLPSEAKHTEGHSVVKLSDATANLKENCQAKLSDVRGNLSEIKQCLADIENTASTSKHVLLSLFQTDYTQKKLEDQQVDCTSLLRRIKLFLDFEEQAWQKRFSVDLVQESRNLKHRVERLMKMRGRLVEAQEGLQQALAIQDPLLLLQTSQNTDWGDLYEGESCSRQIQEVREWRGPKPVASAKIMPLFQTLKGTFSGDDIKLNPQSAHPGLELCVASGSLWLSKNKEHSGGPYSVLGCDAFRDGVHHWEVMVADVPGWTVGISYAPPQGEVASAAFGSDDVSWALSYTQSRGQFCAEHGWYKFCFTNPAPGLPSRIGVFLDVDSGILSFYDALRLEHLHTFYCSLNAPVYAAFSINVEPEGEGLTKIRVINPEKNQ